MKTVLKYTKFNKQTVFLPALLAIYVFLSFWSESFIFELSDFYNRIIGVATFHNVDVVARISTFYNGVIYGITTLIASNIILNAIFSSRLKALSTWIKYLSITGIFLLCFSVFNTDIWPSLLLIACLITFFLIISVSNITLNVKSFSNNHYLWLVIYSFLACFVLSYFFNISSEIVFFLILMVILLIAYTYLNLKISHNIPINFYKVRFLVLFPVIAVLSQEIFLVFNNYGFILPNPMYITATLFLIAFILGIVLSSKSKNNYFSKLNKFYLSWFVFGLILFSTYSVYVKLEPELFEIANSSNSILSIFEFGKFPIAEFLGSHLMADFFTPVIYTIINGYDSNFNYISYFFLFDLAYYFAIFLLLLRITENKYFALVSILFFPYFSNVFFSISSFPLLLIPLIIFYVYKKPDFKRWLFLFIYMIFIAAWKPDTGLIGILGIITGCLLIIYYKYPQINKKSFILAVTIPFGLLFVFLSILEFIFNLPVQDGISKTLEFYSSSPQARGLPQIAENYDRIFKIQHIFYPIIVIVIGFFAISKINRSNKNNLLLIFTIIIFTVFYVFNVQRGLTRHTFAEGGDNFITSFALIIIGLSVFLLNIKRANQYILFYVIVSILVIGFKFPAEPGGKIIYGQAFTSLIEKRPVYSNNQINRALINEKFYSKEIKHIDQFLGSIPKGETFYDFSNTPALYYISGKNMPVYFIHQLAITNESLQIKELESMSNYNIPFVIYSNHPPNWWDNTDGIPNSVRFYKIAEFIYSNYAPYKIIGNYSVWKKPNYKTGIGKNYPIDTASSQLKVYNLKMLPYIRGTYDEQLILSKHSYTEKLMPPYSLQNFNINNKDNGHYLCISLYNPKKIKDQVIVDYFEKNNHLGQFAFDVPGKDKYEKFVLRLSTQYRWHLHNPDSISVRLNYNYNEVFVNHLELIPGD